MDASIIKRLLNRIPQQGKVEWIGVRPGSKEPIEVVDSVEAEISQGLVGDRFQSTYSDKRQVTLIQSEHILAIQSILNNSKITPDLLRRNIVVSGINLLSLKDKKFSVGEAMLEMTGLCHPCSRMEEALGDGGYNAMRGHGGITARVIKNGLIKVGNKVYFDGTS